MLIRYWQIKVSLIRDVRWIVSNSTWNKVYIFQHTSLTLDSIKLEFSKTVTKIRFCYFLQKGRFCFRTERILMNKSEITSTFSNNLTSKIIVATQKQSQTLQWNYKNKTNLVKCNLSDRTYFFYFSRLSLSRNICAFTPSDRRENAKQLFYDQHWLKTAIFAQYFSIVR